MVERKTPNLDDYRVPKSDPGGPLEPGEYWDCYDLPGSKGVDKVRIRMKKVDGISARVYPWRPPSTETHEEFLRGVRS